MPLQPIPTVSTKALAEACATGAIDPNSAALLEGEWPYLRARRGLPEAAPRPDDLRGLAISGGGIRSAVFALGVMQALAKRSWLGKMDYLSTVSGGGYIGSALTWRLNARSREGNADGQFGVGENDFPFGTDDPRALPKDGQDGESQQRLLRFLRQHGNYLTPGNGIGGGSLIAIILRGVLLNLLVWVPILTAVMMIFGLAQVYPALRYASLGLTALFVVACVVYSFHTYRDRGAGSTRRYKQRRWFESMARRTLWAIVLLGLVGSLPLVANKLAGQSEMVLGPISVMLGFFSGLRVFIRSASTVKSKVSIGVQATVGAALLLYGLLLTTYSSGAWLLGHEQSAVAWATYAGLVAVAVASGWFVNLNYISIHRYYRDRLMETFMPDLRSALGDRTGAAHDADRARISEMCDEHDPRGPYHLLNTNAVLVDSDDRRIGIRGGDNFIISPRYCGSNATGWRPSRDWMHDGMTLATAVAISGAAANPHTGVGGDGVTRNPLVSLFMAMLNLRLGYWAHNTHAGPRPAHAANHIIPGLYEITSMTGGRGYREDRKFVQISDGGHFENLALYELVRRRLRLIVVCDAGADPDFSFGDLQTTLRRIDKDFGARVDFADDQRPGVLIPKPYDGYPPGAKRAARGHIEATITYADGSTGRLIFMKTTMVPGLSMETKGYKGANPAFPDQSTADQFFDEEQFEAYRELGYRIAMKMIDDVEARGTPFDATAKQPRKQRRSTKKKLPTA